MGLEGRSMDKCLLILTLIGSLFASFSASAKFSVYISINQNVSIGESISLEEEILSQHELFLSKYQIKSIEIDYVERKIAPVNVRLLKEGVEAEIIQEKIEPGLLRLQLHPAESSVSPLDLDLNGDITFSRAIKVHSILVELQEATPTKRFRKVLIGEVKAGKIGESHSSFDVDSRRVIAIILEGSRRKVDIRRVEVRYRNRRWERLEELEGRIKDGGRRTLFIGNRKVREIRIVSKSKEFFGPRGRFKVFVRVKN